MPKVASPPLPENVTAAQLGRAVGLSERAVAGRKLDGRLPAHAGGGIALAPILRAGIASLASGHRTHAGAGLDLTAERARLAKEQADAMEMRNAATRGELIPRAEVVAGMQGALAYCRARLLALPDKAAPLVAAEADPRAVRDVLAELAATRAVPALPERAEPGMGRGKKL